MHGTVHKDHVKMYTILAIILFYSSIHTLVEILFWPKVTEEYLITFILNLQGLYIFH